MTGPEHYAEAERLLALAERHSSGATYGPEWTLPLAAAHGPTSPRQGPASACPEAPDATGPESGSAPRPAPLFFPPPPEPGLRY